MALRGTDVRELHPRLGDRVGVRRRDSAPFFAANHYDARRVYLRLLRRNRDFRLLYVGTLISLGGDWFLTVALLDLVLQLTGSATLASLMLLCQSLPIFIFTPIAGHVVDRVDRR